MENDNFLINGFEINNEFLDKLNNQLNNFYISTPYQITTNNPCEHNPCEYCSNNPKNNKFASGVCHCTLPYMNNTIY